MIDGEKGTLFVSPVISYPREAECSKTYLFSIDLRPSIENEDAWPLEEEECVIYCFLNTTPLFSNRVLGEPAIVVHRYGGSYGPARFLLTASDEEKEGEISVTLVNGWGVPLDRIPLPNIRVTRQSAAGVPYLGVVDEGPMRLDSDRLKVFISYTHADKEMRQKLEDHLITLKRSGEITIWQDQEILPGDNWNAQIKNRLEEADVILLLVSASFFASQYCWEVEVQEAIKRHNAGTAWVIPILLRPVDWQNSLLGQLQALPTKAKPIAEWNDQVAAFEDVVLGIRKVIQNLRSLLSERKTENPLPAILVGGVPHAGKSVLTYNLTRRLRQLKIPHYVFRASPDGEGDWFFEGDPAYVRQIRVKGTWTDTFRRLVCQALPNRLLPLIVDINGLPNEKDHCIFRACTHSILVLRDEKEQATQTWHNFTTSNGLIPLAELRSQLSGYSELTAREPALMGTITGLERGGHVYGPVFNALVERVCELFNAYSLDDLEKSHLDDAPTDYVVHLDHQLEALVPDVDEWTLNLLEPLLAGLPTQAALSVYGYGPNWLYGTLALHARKQPFYQFDPCLGWVQPPLL